MWSEQLRQAKLRTGLGPVGQARIMQLHSRRLYVVNLYEPSCARTVFGEQAKLALEDFGKSRVESYNRVTRLDLVELQTMAGVKKLETILNGRGMFLFAGMSLSPPLPPL